MARFNPYRVFIITTIGFEIDRSLEIMGIVLYLKDEDCMWFETETPIGTPYELEKERKNNGFTGSITVLKRIIRIHDCVEFVEAVYKKKKYFGVRFRNLTHHKNIPSQGTFWLYKTLEKAEKHWNSIKG